MVNSMTRRWAVLALLVVSAIWLTAPVSAGANTIGSSLTGSSSPVGCEAATPTCILSQGYLHGDVYTNVVPQAGSISGFTLRHVAGDVAFLVLRTSESGYTSIVNHTGYFGGPDELAGYYFPVPMDVQRGDYIGLALAAGATVGARDASADSQYTNLLELTNSNSPVFAGTNRREELFLQADYSPSATGGDSGGGGSGGGGLTNLPDPLAALRAGKRPTIKLSHKAVRASKKGYVAIRMRNPNGYRVKGKLTLAFKGFKKAKSFSLASRRSTSVRFKLSRKAARRLYLRRKLRTKLTARFRGPIGKTGTARARITVKAPKIRKRKSPGGGGGGGNTFDPCIPAPWYMGGCLIH